METKEKTSETFRSCTWFGLNAGVEIGRGFWHKTGFGNLLFPHPALVNWLLRLGLLPDDRNRLTFIHEFGHLQTVPVYFLYSVLFISMVISNESKSFIEISLAILSTLAAWEIISEMYTIYHVGPLYKLYYQGVSVLPRLIFWITMVILNLSGWVILLR